MATDTATLTGRLADRPTWSTAECPIGKALELVGTRSAMLILREAFYGTRRFDDFAERVGITEAVTSARLKELVAAGLLEREPYREPGQRTRYGYRLTAKGADLAPAVIGLFDWGSTYLSPGGRAPLRLTHADCDAPVHARLRCDAGHDVALGEVVVSAPRRR